MELLTRTEAREMVKRVLRRERSWFDVHFLPRISSKAIGRRREYVKWGKKSEGFVRGVLFPKHVVEDEILKLIQENAEHNR